MYTLPAATPKHTSGTFYKAVNPTTLVSDNEYDYVNCTVSPASSREPVASAAFELSTQTSASQSSLHQLSAGNEYDYVNFTMSPESSKETVASAVPLNTAIHTLQDQATTMEYSITELSTQTSALQSSLYQLSAQLKAVYSEVEQLKQQVGLLRQQGGSSSSVATRMLEEPSDIQQNIKYLSSLNQTQVSTMNYV